MPEYWRCDADGALALLGEAGVVEDQDGVALGGQGEHPPDPLAVEVVFVPDHLGEQALEALLGGAGDDLGDGVAVLVGLLGQQAGEVAFQGGGALAAGEVDVERFQELGQFRQRFRRCLQDSHDGVPPLFYAGTPIPQSSISPDYSDRPQQRGLRLRLTC